jgi:hypothetical protein
MQEVEPEFLVHNPSSACFPGLSGAASRMELLVEPLSRNWNMEPSSLSRLTAKLSDVQRSPSIHGPHTRSRLQTEVPNVPGAENPSMIGPHLSYISHTGFCTRST